MPEYVGARNQLLALAGAALVIGCSAASQASATGIGETVPPQSPTRTDGVDTVQRDDERAQQEGPDHTTREAYWFEQDDPCPAGTTLLNRRYDRGDEGQHVSCVDANGANHGRATFFYSNGNPEMTGAYSHGRPVGVWTHWNQEGRFTRANRH